jgi:hypothetical protein
MSILLERDIVVEVDVRCRAVFVINLAPVPLALDRNSVRVRLRWVESAAQTPNTAIILRRAAVEDIVYSRVVERRGRTKREDLVWRSDAEFDATSDTEPIFRDGDVGPGECEGWYVALCGYQIGQRDAKDGKAQPEATSYST